MLYKTIDVYNDMSEPLVSAQYKHMAALHAEEATRLLNEFATYIADNPGTGYMGTPVPVSLAHAHAAVSQAYSALI